ncbi:hypothetical protein AB1Y20_018674 [Prymnesium parvum]|uniref:UmuC domain-containing protein n=1 Tax=Prymnesium parvum TaxID=97485 RepID=A0AB34JPF8_PRYPA
MAAAWERLHPLDARGTPSRLFTDDDPATTVKGLGFRDADAARQTIRLASQPGRRSRQYWAVRAMAERARLAPHPSAGTRAALEVFERWLRSPPPPPPPPEAREEHAQRALLLSSCANAHARSRCASDDDFRRRAAEDRREAAAQLRAALRGRAGAPFPLSAPAFAAAFGAPGEHAYGSHVCEAAAAAGLAAFRCTCAYAAAHVVDVTDAEAVVGRGAVQSFSLRFERGVAEVRPRRGADQLALSSSRGRPLTSAMLELPAASPPAAPAVAALSAESSSLELLCVRRVVCLIDLDCFYAQCEELRDPSLRGAAVGVQQKMIVITSNYAARAHGVRKGDSVDAVRRKCPSIRLLCGEDLTFYRSVSQRVFELLCAWRGGASAVERAGMDEFYVDLSDEVERTLARLRADGVDAVTPEGYLYPSPHPAAAPVPLLAAAGESLAAAAEAACAARLAVGSAACAELRAALHASLRLTSSAGVSVSKLLAKLTASTHKPHAQTLFLPTRPALAALLPPSLAVSKLPGIGFAATRSLGARGVRTVGELLAAAGEPAATPREAKALGAMRAACLGLCGAAVRHSAAPRSVSAEESFWRAPLTRLAPLEAAAAALCAQLMAKLRADEEAYGPREPSALAVSLRLKGEAAAEAEATRRSTRQVRFPPQLRLARAPRREREAGVEGEAEGGEAAAEAEMCAADRSLVEQLARRAVALFLSMLPGGGSEPFPPVHIFNIALRFDRAPPPPQGGSDITSFFERGAREGEAGPRGVLTRRDPPPLLWLQAEASLRRGHGCSTHATWIPRW